MYLNSNIKFLHFNPTHQTRSYGLYIDVKIFTIKDIVKLINVLVYKFNLNGFILPTSFINSITIYIAHIFINLLKMFNINKLNSLFFFIIYINFLYIFVIILYNYVKI